VNTKYEETIVAFIVPCFNEEEILPYTISKLSSFLSEMIKKNQRISSKSFILLINDCSTDQTWKLIEQSTEQYSFINGLSLSKNVGHQNALLSGLLNVVDKCDVTISIDADLQDDIQVISEMMQLYYEGNEIVYGVRKKRSTDTMFKSYSAILFYKLMSALGTNTVYNHADFRLMGNKSLKALSQYDEVNLFLRGIVSNLGFKSTSVYYERLERQAGITKYTLHKMIHLAWDGITSFSLRPLRLISLLGVFCFFMSIIGGLLALYGKFIKGTAVPGWTSIVLTTYFLGGIQLLSIGLIGEYIGKIYSEVKHRPKYYIEKNCGNIFI
jgi:glycosyltransferase involved in cell wall biosynthesis